ncbi:class I SAM-dependent methyltransferase [Myxococcota bacterium]|nr:class I SAM-dependent methyltransferase [Myxococcota bacterium]
MAHERRFSADHAARLDTPERYQRQPVEPLVELIQKAHAQDILDVGVGTGYLAIPVAAAMPDSEVTGLDVEPRMLEQLEARAREQKLKNITPLLSSGESIALKDATVDMVTMVNLYHELDDRPSSLAEVKRVLRPGGKLMICDWDAAGDLSSGPPKDHRLMIETVEEELREAGFATIERHEFYESFFVVVGGV